MPCELQGETIRLNTLVEQLTFVASAEYAYAFHPKNEEYVSPNMPLLVTRYKLSEDGSVLTMCICLP